MNAFKTAIYMTALTLLLVFLGRLWGGQSGMVVFFVIALAMNFVSYWFSDKIVLAMYRAKEVAETEAPDLYRIVRGLSEKAGLPMPRVYLIPGAAPNAFATGRNPNHAAVAVTEGILRMLGRDEIEGVLSHELAHVKNRDILIGTFAATIAGAVSMLANIAKWGLIFGGGRSDDDDGHPVVALVMMIVAPIAALLIQLAVSRSREFEADRTGAGIAGNPLPLASALRKIHMASQQIPFHANPATAHMFIVSPLTGGGILKVFSTHPSVEDRIHRLEEMAAGRA